MSLLEIKDLKVSFVSGTKKTTVIDGVSFDIGDNEVVGLIGESGSGKTITAFSIMRILAKNAQIEKGIIGFDGDDILKLSEGGMRLIRGNKIAIVFQEPFTSLNPVLRVGYQIEESLFMHQDITKREAKHKVMTLLEKVRIKQPDRIFHGYPHQLSGGERQRVMVAMAIALGPRLLIADEPTTALDVTVQSEILKLLRTLKEELNMSLIFITHDFGIINEMADRIVVMRHGKVVDKGLKKEVLMYSKHPYTQKLIQAVPKIEERLTDAPLAKDSHTLIETKKLTKSFSIERGAFRREVGKIFAVKDVDMVIKKGQTVGLVGESGCGKSTLGRLLLGLEHQDAGEILVNGKPFRGTPIRRIREMMQIVFQDPYSSLDPRIPMGEIVLEGAKLIGLNIRERESVLRYVLGKVRLSYDDRLKYPHQFSGGERQRIAIARALAVKPEFLVLDEPVSSLDVLIQQDVLTLLKELKDDIGVTYLFISHDLRLVEYMSDVVYVMYNGGIVESGTRGEIYRNPKHPYTKQLLESIPVF